ncbi:MAG: SDR family NAD(P)-dependent oxidoreductase [Rhodobiaceae bacterium]|nr:SDR family NAD(P)-dependent oxidoreductase [Rhodobiaceae bacterium]
MDLQLRGKTALITGSYRGTGEAIAGLFAREGATVIVHGLEPGTAEPVAEAICAEGHSAHAVTGDIRTDEGAAAAAQAALALGPVDILINNYGTADRASWSSADSAAWHEAYDTNVLSAVRMISHLTGPMKERGWGRVIQLGTIGSTTPAARMPHYYASKGALHTLTVSLAKELAGTGVTSNIVSPGLIKTKEVEAWFQSLAKKNNWGEAWDEIEARAMKEVTGGLTGRIARTEEVAALVAFVASPLAESITSTNFRIDGGATAIVS